MTMDRRLVYRAAAVAAIVALVGVLAQLAASLSVPGGTSLQPYGVSEADFLDGPIAHPDAALLFFASDTLFLLSYLLVFVGLYAVTADRARPFAIVGLGAGIVTMITDAAENAFFVVHILLAREGAPVNEPALPLLYVITTLKWTAAFATLYTFAIVFPRQTQLERLLVLLMLAFPAFGVLSIAVPSLFVWRGIFFLIGMPVFAWYFWTEMRLTGAAESS